MKPRTKQQEFMVAWANAHTAMTPRQEQYAYKHSFWEVALVSRGKCYCTKCKNTWKDKEAEGKAKVTCPHCGKELEVMAHKTKVKMITYFSVFTTVKGMQVCKWYHVFRNCKMNGTEEYAKSYLGTEFLTEDGKLKSVEIKRAQMCWNRELWSYGSEPEIRKYSFFDRYVVGSASYYERVLPILRRNGFKTNRLYEGREMSVMQGLLSNPIIESLVKIGHVGVIYDWLRYGRAFDDDELTAIKLANRHHVVFDSRNKWTDFKDYLRDLKELGKDIHNPTILFPKDFQNAHKKLNEKVMEKRQREQRERERQMALERLQKDKARKAWINKYAAKFTGMELSNGTFVVKPLISYKEFEAEAIFMHHCIATYYGKQDTLLLSIEHDGEKCETAEIDLKNEQIIQCRSRFNQPSQFHDIIVKMLKNFMGEFTKRYKMNAKQNTLPVLASYYKYQKAI